MHSIQDGQTSSDQTQPVRPNIHQINVMENPETRQTSDGLGKYEKVDQPKEGTYENIKMDTEEGKKDEGKKDEGKKDEGTKAGEKDTVVIVDPTSLDSGKGDCCTRFKKFCRENKCLVGWMCIIIFLCILFFALYIDSKMKCKDVSEATATSSTGFRTGTAKPDPTDSTGVRTRTTAKPDPTDSTGVRTRTTAKPDPTDSTEPPAPVCVMQGVVTTINNYTTALADHTSVAFKTFDNSFAAAVMCFYADNHPEYLAYYKDTQVTSIERDGLNTVVHFEIDFSQLDNDNIAPPDAHSVLNDQLRSLGQFGTFVIINLGSLTRCQSV